ncbi:hypothetical protein FQA39_LY16633 [Lamprigera yunnana]|nr:hypothetical protein FQA39_LY16633 [Lamprigera yunnana]
MDISELSNKLICEKHFIPTDININNKRKLLNKNAVPVKYVEPIISVQVAQTSATSNELNAPSFENNTLHVLDTNYVKCTNPNLNENDEFPYDLEILNAKSMGNPVICGRRIIDLEYFLNALKSLKHEGFGCIFFDLSVLS